MAQHPTGTGCSTSELTLINESVEAAEKLWLLASAWLSTAHCGICGVIQQIKELARSLALISATTLIILTFKEINESFTI